MAEMCWYISEKVRNSEVWRRGEWSEMITGNGGEPYMGFFFWHCKGFLLEELEI